MRIWLIARDGNTRNETTSPVTAPTATSNSRSIVESSGLAWFIAGTSNTITAVTVAALRLGLMAPMKAIGATASTSSASKSTLPGMRDQYRDSAAIDRAADRAEHVIAGRLQATGRRSSG